VILPEIGRLFGVPQPAKYHPEIDTGIHTLMVLEQAALATSNPVVRFAALVHDLGKALTPARTWPMHTGHEALGAEAITKMAERLRIPNEYSELGSMVSLQHTRCHRASRHEAEDLFLTLELTDALRRPERFELFLRACEADARGRLGLEHEPYPQAALLRQALAAARQVNIKALVQQHKDPQTLAPAIRQARISAITALKT
jgi:tRNA nucleotidyltransferase (CCA-adding enzyme)